MSTPNVKDIVREKYGNAALRVKSGGGVGNPCCRENLSAADGLSDPITSNLYDTAQVAGHQSLSWLRQSHCPC